MMRDALPLALCLAASPSLACVERSIAALADSAIVSELTAGGPMAGAVGEEWEVTVEEHSLQAVCSNCDTVNAFDLTVAPIPDSESPEALRARRDELIANYCETIAPVFDFRCGDVEPNDLGGLPGASVSLEGPQFQRREFVFCTGTLLQASASAHEETAALANMSRHLRNMIRFLVRQ